jgi:hypothetical protein
LYHSSWHAAESTDPVIDISEGLDLTNLDSISPEEINANLMRVWSWRGSQYELAANSLMLDYAPDFAKLHRWASDLFGRPDKVNIVLLGIQNIHSYMMLGWETGLRSQFLSCRRNGLSKEQIILGHVPGPGGQGDCRRGDVLHRPGGLLHGTRSGGRCARRLEPLSPFAEAALFAIPG